LPAPPPTAISPLSLHDALPISPFAVSGGQQQRIALAGGLALRPDLLLLDEPTSMLDDETAERVREAILAAAGGAGLVIAEHRLGPWLDHVDRLVVLGEQARVLADGEPHAVLREHRDLLHEAGALTADAPPAGRPAG